MAGAFRAPWYGLEICQHSLLNLDTDLSLLDVLESSKDFDRWVAFNSMLPAEICLDCAVNLCKCNILLLQLCSSLFIFWGKCLAVTAPKERQRCST